MMNAQRNEQVEFATAALRRNEDIPNKWTAIDACDAVSAIHPRVFAKHPKLRNTSVLKILQFRLSRDDDVLESLERLRTTLQLCLSETPWKEDKDSDAWFRESVNNADLVSDPHNDEENRNIGEPDDEEEFYDQQHYEDEEDDESECDGEVCYKPYCPCQHRY